ncbi:unnamed protein product, partial [Ascophyllum nodosum]
GKRTYAEFASALHVEPFNTATKLYSSLFLCPSLTLSFSLSSISLPIASHVLCLLCSKMRCGMTLLRKQK